MLKVSVVSSVRRHKVLCLWLESFLLSFLLVILAKNFSYLCDSGAFTRVKGN